MKHNDCYNRICLRNNLLKRGYNSIKRRNKLKFIRYLFV